MIICKRPANNNNRVHQGDRGDGREEEKNEMRKRKWRRRRRRRKIVADGVECSMKGLRGPKKKAPFVREGFP